MRARRVSIRGRVQGVGFREGLRREADRAGVGGWVRNRLDGSVEALVFGERDAVERVLAWAAHGPISALVVNFDVTECEVPLETANRPGFELRPTA